MESVCACVSIRIYLPSLLSRSPIFRDPMIKIPENKSVIKKREKKKIEPCIFENEAVVPPLRVRVHILYMWNRVILRFILRFIPARFPCPRNLSVFAFVENHNVSTADISAK